MQTSGFQSCTLCTLYYLWLKAQTMGLLPPEVTSPLVAGRLGMYIDTWKVLTSNLSSQSIQNPFVSLPSQDTIPTKPVFAPE